MGSSLKNQFALRVITVEDSHIVVDRLRSMFSDMDEIIFVGNAASVSEAMELIDEHKPDAAILDINLKSNAPDGNGISLLIEIKKQYPKIYTIMFTNMSAPQYRNSCLMHGADYFLDKSNDFDRIPETLKEITMEITDKKNVMIIDDDPVSIMISTKIIQMHVDYNIVSFTQASEALRQLSEWSVTNHRAFPDVIFLDINMPRMNGWEFLDEFIKLPEVLTRNCEVMMLTSSIDFRDIEKSKSYTPVRDFISKPLTGDKLSGLLRNSTDQSL